MGITLLLYELGDDDTRFLVTVAFPEEVPATIQRMTDEDPVIGRAVRDDDVAAAEGPAQRVPAAW